MIMGIENEFKLLGSQNEELNANNYIPLFMEFSKGGSLKRNHISYRLWTGGALYVDGLEPEVTTPPIEVRRGSIRTVVNSLVQNRNVLVDMIEAYNGDKYNLKLKGYSAHYNFSSDHVENMVIALAKGPAFPLLLLIEQGGSQGVRIKSKPGRVELGGDYTVNPDQMRAAIAFMLGTIDGIKSGVDYLTGAPDFSLEAQYWFKLYTSKLNTAPAIQRRSKSKKSKGGATLDEVFAYYFNLFRENIAKYSEDEVELLEEFVSGKRKLEVESKSFKRRWYWPFSKRPIIGINGYETIYREEQEEFELPELAAAFGRAAQGKEEINGINLQTQEMGWDSVKFMIKIEKNKLELRIHRDNLVSFYSNLDNLNGLPNYFTYKHYFSNTL